MQTGLLVNVILPLALFLIMFGMGMTLVVGDFKRIVKQPKAFAIGISAQPLRFISARVSVNLLIVFIMPISNTHANPTA